MSALTLEQIWGAIPYPAFVVDGDEVVAWIDLEGLLDPRPEGVEALNGIAFDRAGGRLFVTGKYWWRLYEIEVPERVGE